MNTQTNSSTSIAAHVFAETSKTIRTVTIGEDIMFIAKDVAEALGYKRADQAVAAHCDEPVNLPPEMRGSLDSRLKLISEPDVYALIFGSKLPSAKAFKRWVTKEVLPNLRKHGGYTVGQEALSKEDQEYINERHAVARRAMSIQTINANAVIIIDGRHFKANESGMWNLTDIWRTLGLPKSKQPGQWRTKSAQRFTRMQKMHSANDGLGHEYIHADKQATLKYAGWVSDDFEDMVYAAFEAVLAMPEVAAVVANKMVELGHIAEAEQFERLSNADRDYAHAQMKHWRDRTTNQARCKAVLNGHLTLTQAKAQGLKGVWLTRCVNALEAMNQL